MTRIIILSYDYPPNNGGIARLCGEIVNCCNATNTPYLVVTNVAGNNDENIVRIVGKRGAVEWKILRYLRKHLTADDIILTGTFHPDGLLALLSGCKRVYMLAHGAEFLPGDNWFRKVVWKRYRKLVLSKATKVIANSHYTAKMVKQCSPIANVVAIPLAVDNVHFRPTKPKHNDGLLHLCSISRLEKFKAHDFVIETIAKLPDEYRHRIRFEIAGKGKYKPELERLVERHQLAEIVTFLGFVADEKLCDFYSRNDVFILCTREEPEARNVEGFGLVFSEAQACGTPAIGTHAGGIPDAIDEGNGGWLIEQDHNTQLSQLLMGLINNPDIIAIQSQKALQRINEHCTWDKYFAKLMQELKF